MLTQSIGMTENDARRIAEMYLSRYNQDIVTSEPSNSFYNHWVCQTANATYHLYMGVADTE